MKLAIKQYVYLLNRAPLWVWCCMIALAALASGCAEDNNEWSKDYDIEWPVSTITGIQPTSAAPGDSVTVSGTNLHFTYNIYIGSFECVIGTRTETQLRVAVPANVTEPSVVSVFNLYRRTYEYTDVLFVPILN
ncbi:MAG: IPT/TIG domain-containing protein [Tannerellaceae bacterium]|nr:IPT/TIG domain-containing protein [Tannerellaceae bacterium]